MTIQIKKLTIPDVSELQTIARQTFYETFSADNSEENMARYLDERLSLKQLTTELLDPNAEFYFAMLNDKTVGYLKINFGSSQTELKDDKAVEIERIYVLKEYLGKNVGQALYNQAIQVAQQKGAEYIWLGVWEKNARAIAFYKKNGFVEFNKHIFTLGDDEQTDIMMKLVLQYQ